MRLLQLRHAADHPELKRPDVVGAVDALEAAGLVASDDAGRLTEAYRFLRRVENRIRIRHGRSESALLPESPDDRADLATRLGIDGDLLEEATRRREWVHGFYTELLNRLSA